MIYISDFNILKIMVNFCEKNEKVAMVGPKIFDSNDNLGIPYISRPLVWDYIKKYLLCPFYLITKLFYNYEKSILCTSKFIKVYSLTGCILLIRATYLKAVNMLDENIFLFGEELILGEKFFKNNLEVYYLSTVKVRHIHSITMDKVYDSINKLRIRLKSNLYYIENYRDDIPKFSKILIKISFYFEIFIYQPVFKFLKKIKILIN